MDLILKLIDCKKYNLFIFGDLKSICFLSLCWVVEQQKTIAFRKNIVGCANVKYTPIVNLNNIILPPLHIKLELIKDLAKAIDKNAEGSK